MSFLQLRMGFIQVKDGISLGLGWVSSRLRMDFLQD